MTDRTLLVVLVAVAVLAVAPLGAAGGFIQGAPAQEETATPTPTPTPTPDEDQAMNETTVGDSNASLGASVSAFMQSSAAEAEGEVDRGMFAARFNASDEEARDELVRERAETLETRLEELRAERAALLDDGNATVAERAKAARLTTRIEALQNALDQTEHAAERANVSLNRTKLSALREAAGNLSGPEVAALATDIVDRPERGQGPPVDRGNGTDNGPPDDAGAGGNQGDGNQSDDNQAGNGPPDDAGAGGNQSDDNQGDGPPDDAGADENQSDSNQSDSNQSDGNQTDNGPPDDTGADENQSDDNQTGNGDDSENGNAGGGSDGPDKRNGEA